MIFSTFFHHKKVQVLWSNPEANFQPAYWALGFQGPIDPQSGMIINLKEVLRIQEEFLRKAPTAGPEQWLKQSRSFVQALPFPGARLSFVTSLFFLLMKVKLELHSETSRWVFERHHFFEVGSEVIEGTVRTDLRSPDHFQSFAEEVWPQKFASLSELEKFLALKGDYLVKPFLKTEGFTSSNY